jgi:hypothetical protein
MEYPVNDGRMRFTEEEMEERVGDLVYELLESVVGTDQPPHHQNQHGHNNGGRLKHSLSFCTHITIIIMTVLLSRLLQS